jgi:hypothetical protein
MDPMLKGPKTNLNASQQRATEGVNSVISVPLWLRREKKVIGVLNLVSTYHIAQTRFDDSDVIKLLSGYADSLALASAICVDGLRDPS